MAKNKILCFFLEQEYYCTKKKTRNVSSILLENMR